MIPLKLTILLAVKDKPTELTLPVKSTVNSGHLYSPQEVALKALSTPRRVNAKTAKDCNAISTGVTNYLYDKMKTN